MSTTGASNANTNVISCHVLLCDNAGILRKSRRKHHEQMIRILVVICFRVSVWQICATCMVSIIPPPDIIFFISSSQSGPTISSASSMIVYLMSSVSLLCCKKMCSELLDTREGKKVWLLHEVDQATRSSNQNVTTLTKLILLLSRRGAAIGNARTKH